MVFSAAFRSYQQWASLKCRNCINQFNNKESKNNVQISVFFHHRNKNIISRIIEVTSPSTSLFLQKKMKCLIISSEKNEAPHYFLVSGSTAGLLARSWGKHAQSCSVYTPLTSNQNIHFTFFHHVMVQHPKNNLNTICSKQCHMHRAINPNNGSLFAD